MARNKLEKKEYDKQYREKNKEKIREYQKQYKETHKEQAKEYWKKYKADNKSKIKIKQRERRLNNKDKIKEYNQSHRHSHGTRRYTNIHNTTDAHIRKYNLRPLVCSICWCEWKIEAHHPNYDKWNEVVFVCNSCHHYIHSWEIKDYKVLNLLEIINE